MNDPLELEELPDGKLQVRFRQHNARAIYKYDPDARMLRRLLFNDSQGRHDDRKEDPSLTEEDLVRQAVGEGALANADARARKYHKMMRRRARRR